MSIRLQIGIRAHDMERSGTEELVKNISGKGFCCTQLALSKAIYDVNTAPEALTPGFAMYLKRLFSKYNVDVAVLGCYLNLADPDEEILKRTKEVYKAHIRFASLLGCGVVGTETGALNSEYLPAEENKSDKAFDIFVGNLKEIVSYAEKAGVIVAIEPVATHIIYDAKRARAALDAVNSPNLQIIFDPVNIMDRDNYMRQDEIIKEFFDLLGKDIACIHAKDFIIDANGNTKSVIAGDGMLNYKLIMSILRKKKPYIHLLLEETEPCNVMNAKEYIEIQYEKS